jgi:hypothetical protein
LASYPILEISNDHSTYKFMSNGPNGSIYKIIVFPNFFPDSNIYNMALGDVLADNKVSDTNISNNGDIRKIFATVAKILTEYITIFPDRTIFFQGSDDIGKRSSVYHRAISQYYHLMENEFIFEGVTQNDVKEPFNPESKYQFFLVRRK